MKLQSGFISLALVLSATIVSSIPVTRRDVDESLVPQFGFSAGVNPTGTGDCDGAVNGSDGQPVKVPCSCPPDRATFIQNLNANVAAGHVVNNPSVSISFPGDNSTTSQLARINAATVTLQNLNGPGQGCPVASTTFQAQAAAINNANGEPSSATIPSPISTFGTIGPEEPILMARQLSSDPSLTPTFSAVSPVASTPVITVSESVPLQSSAPAISASGPIASTPVITVSESVPLQSSAPAISVINSVGSTTTIGVSESATSQIPTATGRCRFPPVVEDTLEARQLAPTNCIFPPLNEFILKARDSESPVPSPAGGILKARQLAPINGVFPKPDEFILKARDSESPVSSPVGDVLKARQLAPINGVFIKPNEFILKARNSESPVPSPTLPVVAEFILKARQLAPINGVFIKPDEFILKARDSESPVPSPTFSFPGFAEAILARQSTPSSSPSPKPEIILAGPPVIERR